MFRVYKSYNGNAPDSENLALFQNEEDARKAVERLNELHKQERDPFFLCEGWEWSAYYTYGEAKLEPVTYAKFEEMLEEELADMEAGLEEEEP